MTEGYISMREAWEKTQASFPEENISRQYFIQLLSGKRLEDNLPNILVKNELDHYHWLVHEESLNAFLAWRKEWKTDWVTVSQICREKEYPYNTAISFLFTLNIPKQSGVFPLSIRKEDRNEFERRFEERFNG